MNIEANSPTRIDCIDFAKAIGMITIIWGHITTSFSMSFVYAFHIPLFFFLSGLVFCPDKYGTFALFVKRKAKTLLLPYIIYSILTWIVWACFSYYTKSEPVSYFAPLLETFIARGSEGYMVHNVPLWFVPCLFVVECSYYWLNKLNNIVTLIMSILLAIISYFLVKYVKTFDFTTMPWSIEVAMLAMVFYCTGHQIVKHFGLSAIQSAIDRNKITFTILMLFAYSLVYIGSKYNGAISMGHAFINNPFIFYPVALIGIFATMIFSCLISSSTANCHRGGVSKMVRKKQFHRDGNPQSYKRCYDNSPCQNA